MHLKKYFHFEFIFTIVFLIIYADGNKNSDEYKPDIARVGKTKKAKMGTLNKIYLFNVRRKILAAFIPQKMLQILFTPQITIQGENTGAHNIILAQKTAIGTLSNVITQIQNLPTMDFGRKFRTPCKTGNRCGKVIKRLMVPKLAQLENTIMGIMKEISKMPPGSRLPDKFTKTEPIKLLFDQNYKEDVCMDKLESCLKEDKRRKRILKKLFFKKYNALRQELIGYGGRRLWGGEGNLFYRR